GVEHSTYQSALLDTGAVYNLSFRDFTVYSTRVRAGYDMDGFKPFVEGIVDRRDYDQAVDPFGLQRSSGGYVLRAGIVFERNGLLTGEISAGYTRRTYDDPTLPDISGPILDSSLVWKASALTTVTLGATSAVEETILAGASGRFRHEGRIILDHAFRRWLIGSVNFSYAYEDYVGAGRLDKRMRAGASLTYYLNRTLAVRGELRREWLTSDIPGQDYTANVMMVGLRLQR
ncbi:MAG TPA: outer membrane beta-barrel protein, partial [Xanthobacteraceae bacterium]|nr:outer membrane beta-barrel protein [Xanthobacteraceae bacterium]